MDTLAAWYGEERAAQTVARARRFWAGHGRVMVSVQSNAHGYRQVFDDAKMVAGACAQLQVQAALPGVNVPAVFADYGTISTA